VHSIIQIVNRDFSLSGVCSFGNATASDVPSFTYVFLRTRQDVEFLAKQMAQVVMDEGNKARRSCGAFVPILRALPALQAWSPSGL
jgi:hypothetical protein